MYVAFVISHSNSDRAHFGEVKGWIILVVVRSDPANPHTRRLLSSENPYRIVILKIEKENKTVTKRHLSGTSRSSNIGYRNNIGSRNKITSLVNGL